MDVFAQWCGQVVLVASGFPDVREHQLITGVGFRAV
jgi:hypothetical protein